MNKRLKVGIDLGGTKIEIIVLDKDYKELFRERIPTEQEKGYEKILDNINSLYLKAKKECNLKEHSIGIGIPGSISPKTSLVRNANTVCLIGKPFKKDIENILKHPVFIENDANCFTLAESILGAAKNKSLVFGIIMGTGCGGGIVFNKKIITGLQAIAGEWGHMQIDPSGPECYCKKRGCVETFISGGGVQRMYFQLTGKKKTVQEILIDYRKKEKNALKIMNVFFEKFGISLSNLIDILDPDIVVIGGGLSNIPELYTIGVKEVRKNIFCDFLSTPIVKNKLGDSAGVIGAAMLGI